jgi:hypothetical protein
MKFVVYLVVGALLAGGGCYLYRDANFDPTLFALSKDQVQAMLVDAKTTLPRRDGPKDKIEIWGAGRTQKGVKLNMKYASWAPLLSCDVVITAVTPKESRVVADCGRETSDASALNRTQDGLRAPMFEEHIAATLRKRPFNRGNVDAREAAVVFKNLPGMQREALQAAADDARQRAAHERRR